MYGPPVPAKAGLKTLPLIPGPLNVPSAGEPVNVTGEAVIQYCVASPEKLTTGHGFTVTVCEEILIQPVVGFEYE